MDEDMSASVMPFEIQSEGTPSDERIPMDIQPPDNAPWCIVCGKILKKWDKRCPNMFLTSMSFGSKMSYSLSFSDAVMKNYKSVNIPSKALCCKCCLELEETARIEERLKEIRSDISSSFKRTVDQLRTGEIKTLWQNGCKEENWVCNDGPNILEKSDLGLKIVSAESILEQPEQPTSAANPFKIRIMDPTSINKSVPESAKPGQPHSDLNSKESPIFQMTAEELLKPAVTEKKEDLQRPTPARVVKILPKHRKVSILRNNFRLILKKPDSTIMKLGPLQNGQSKFLPRTLVAFPSSSQTCQILQPQSLVPMPIIRHYPHQKYVKMSLVPTPAPVHALTTSEQINDKATNGQSPPKITHQPDNQVDKISPDFKSIIDKDISDDRYEILESNFGKKNKRKSEIGVRNMNDTILFKKKRWTKLNEKEPGGRTNVARRGGRGFHKSSPSRFSKSAEMQRGVDIHSMLESVTDNDDAESLQCESGAPLRRSAFKKASKRLQIIAKYDKSCKALKEAEMREKSLKSAEESDEPVSKLPKLKEFKIVLSDVLQEKCTHDEDKDAFISSQNSSAKLEEETESTVSCDDSQGSKNCSNTEKSDVESMCNQIQKVILESPPNNKLQTCRKTRKSSDIRINRDPNELFVCDICKLDFIKLDELRNHIEQDHFTPNY